MYPEKPKPTINKITLSQLSVSGIDLGQIMQEVLAKGAKFRFRAKGASMQPFILDGDILTISPLPKTALSIGKVVALLHPQSNSPLVHRIIDKRSDLVLIKADNSFSKDDGWILPDQIIGCLSDIERNGRTIRFGLGIERYLIAFLSKHALLTRIVKVLENHLPNK